MISLLKRSGLLPLALAASWALFIGVVGLVTIYFNLEFDLILTTGIWLLGWLILEFVSD